MDRLDRSGEVAPKEVQDTRHGFGVDLFGQDTDWVGNSAEGGQHDSAESDQRDSAER